MSCPLLSGFPPAGQVHRTLRVNSSFPLPYFFSILIYIIRINPLHSGAGVCIR